MSDLVDLALRYARADGLSQTAIPQLKIARCSRPSEPVHSVQEPSLCFIAQGAKEMTVAGKVYRYRVPEHLVSSVDLPITGQVVEASRSKPYLCWVVAIEPATVFDLARDSAGAPPTPRPAIYVAKSDARLTDAVLRLARCLDDSEECAVLAPAIVREIVYRLLRGKFGGVVRDIGIAGSRTQRISKAIEKLKNAFAEPLEVEGLARLAGMSTSSFHEHFRRVTTLSPLQYQKQLRLHEARRLLLGAGSGAAEVGFRVGYQSASQFSREYARFFGRPPMHDVRAVAAVG